MQTKMTTFNFLPANALLLVSKFSFSTVFFFVNKTTASVLFDKAFEEEVWSWFRQQWQSIHFDKYSWVMGQVRWHVANRNNYPNGWIMHDVDNYEIESSDEEGMADFMTEIYGGQVTWLEDYTYYDDVEGVEVVEHSYLIEGEDADF